MKPGRNDACPCGSGEKYKKCCLLTGAATNPEIPQDLEPADMVRARARAFDEGDFGFIYDTYHGDSYFIRQFPDRAAYLSYGQSSLASDFEICKCRILKERIEGDEARVMFYLETMFKGERTENFELSLFMMTELGWRYHSSQKLDRDDYPGGIEDIDWDDFEKVKDKVFF